MIRLRTISIIETLGKYAMSKLEGKKIMALQPVPDKKYMVVGYMYGTSIYDIMGGELRAGLGNRYRSTSQLDLMAYGDIVVYKQDIAQKSDYGVEDAYSKGYVSCWNFNGKIKKFNKKSLLLRAKKKRKTGNLTGNPDEITQLDILQNPSGFSVSKSKKMICTFDAIGQIQVLRVKDLVKILNANIGIAINNAWFVSDNKLLLMLNTGEIQFYDVQKNASELLHAKGDDIPIVSHSCFNGETLLAYTDNKELIVFDVAKREVIYKELIHEGKKQVRALTFFHNPNTLAIAVNN